MTITRRAFVGSAAAFAGSSALLANIACTEAANSSNPSAGSQRRAMRAQFAIILHGLFVLDLRGKSRLPIYAVDCSGVSGHPHQYLAGHPAHGPLTKVQKGGYSWPGNGTRPDDSNIGGSMVWIKSFSGIIDPSLAYFSLTVPHPNRFRPLRWISSMSGASRIIPGTEGDVITNALALEYDNIAPASPLIPNATDFNGHFHLYAEPDCSGSNGQEAFQKLLDMMDDPTGVKAPNGVTPIPLSSAPSGYDDNDVKTLADVNQCAKTDPGTKKIFVELPTCVPVGGGH